MYENGNENENGYTVIIPSEDENSEDTIVIYNPEFYEENVLSDTHEEVIEEEVIEEEKTDEVFSDEVIEEEIISDEIIEEEIISDEEEVSDPVLVAVEDLHSDISSYFQNLSDIASFSCFMLFCLIFFSLSRAYIRSSR